MNIFDIPFALLRAFPVSDAKMAEVVRLSAELASGKTQLEIVRIDDTPSEKVVDVSSPEDRIIAEASKRVEEFGQHRHTAP